MPRSANPSRTITSAKALYAHLSAGGSCVWLAELKGDANKGGWFDGSTNRPISMRAVRTAADSSMIAATGHDLTGERATSYGVNPDYTPPRGRRSGAFDLAPTA